MSPLIWANLCLVHTKLVCCTSLHVPTQITERVKMGSFDQMFCIIRYQYVSKQFSVRRSRLYSVRSPLVSSSDGSSHQFTSWGRRFQTVQVLLQWVGTHSDPVVPRPHYVQFHSNQFLTRPPRFLTVHSVLIAFLVRAERNNHQVLSRFI